MKFSADLEIEKMLNMFIANEFFAWQQYFMAKVVAKGASLDYSDSVFSSNGNEEIDDHFRELVDYAQSMGFDPEINPKQMSDNTSSPYRDLKLSQSTRELVELLIEEEKQAIEEYEAAAKGKAAEEQPSFRFLISELAKDERVHLKDLEDLLSSISDSEKSKTPTKDDDSEDKTDDEESDEKDSTKDDEKEDDEKDSTKDDEKEDDEKDSTKDDEKEDDSENEDEEKHSPKKTERKIGKPYDLAKDFKEASKKAKKEDADDDDTVNESVIGSFLDCETLLTEAFR